MANIAVLGAGMIGSAIALDLVATHQVTALDKDKKALTRLTKINPTIGSTVVDLKESQDYQSVLEPFDLVICAIPGYIGFETLKKILSAGKNAVDLTFFPENCFDLDYLAKKNNVTAIVDCGVSPGMSNLILGYLDQKLEISNYKCFMGSLPEMREWPFNYKALFSPLDVIEEYTRPARFVLNSEVVIRDALSDCELLEFKQIGTLEAFNADGLRTLIHTMDHIPNMKEKMLRYPGHAEYIRVLLKAGFFSETALDMDGFSFRPLDVTACILRKQWELKATDAEFTVMRITIEGDENGKKRRYIYRLYDKGCQQSGTSSMARTTGYTASAIANYFLQNSFEPGICAPESLGTMDGAYHYILDYLKQREVIYRVEEFTLD